MDGPIGQQLGWVTELSASMLLRLGAVVVLTPLFLIPGVGIAVLGGLCGQVYIKAQLSVKRDVSVAKAPVLGILGGAIAGLRMLIHFSLLRYRSDRVFQHPSELITLKMPSKERPLSALTVMLVPRGHSII